MDRLFYLAMDIGEQMLVVGAEVYRVEDSLNRILKAMGATRVDVFVITNNMTVTVYTDDGASKTQTRRIKDTGTDYEKLHKLNALSRKICSQKMSADEIERELISISSSKKYPQWLISLAYSLISGAFTLFSIAAVFDESLDVFFEKAFYTLKLAAALALGVIVVLAAWRFVAAKPLKKEAKD